MFTIQRRRKSLVSLFMICYLSSSNWNQDPTTHVPIMDLGQKLPFYLAFHHSSHSLHCLWIWLMVCTCFFFSKAKQEYILLFDNTVHAVIALVLVCILWSSSDVGLADPHRHGRAPSQSRMTRRQNKQKITSQERRRGNHKGKKRLTRLGLDPRTLSGQIVNC